MICCYGSPSSDSPHHCPAHFSDPLIIHPLLRHHIQDIRTELLGFTKALKEHTAHKSSSNTMCLGREKHSVCVGGMYHATAQQAVVLLKQQICYYSHFLPEKDSSSLGRLPGPGKAAHMAHQPGIHSPRLQAVHQDWAISKERPHFD